MAGIGELLDQVPQSVQLGFAGIGALFVLVKIIAYLNFILNVFLLSGASLQDYGSPGTWAVVTGASDGLGKEFAFQLASKGFNVVLVSRTLSKLETLAREIQQEFGARTKIVAMDYSRDSDEDYDKLAETLEGLEVGILINNVGQSHSIPVPFLQTPRNELQDIVTINCLGTLKTTQIVAPMLQQRGKGLILTMGSFAGWMPTPYLATYSGSKAFLSYWSASLASELKPQGVDVELCLSYLITTAMSKVRRTSLLIPNPRSFVRSALGKVGNGGYQAVAHTNTPWWSHALMLWVVENTIGATHWAGIWYNGIMHVDIRNRALRKATREAKKA